MVLFSTNDAEVNIYNIRCPIANLEKLKLFNMPFRQIYKILCSMTSVNMFPTFLHLQTLSVTTTRKEWDMYLLWQIMQGMVPFLETLEILQSKWQGKVIL